MKAFTSAAVLTIATIMSFNVMADYKAPAHKGGTGSVVKKSIILNKSYNKGNATIAVGENNIASTGSVNIKDSKVIKSIILNKSDNAHNATVAVGHENTASNGSVVVE